MFGKMQLLSGARRQRPALQGSSLAIDQSLCALGVASALHRDLGCSVLNFAQILLAELDRGCCDVLLQPLPFRRSWNWHHPGLLSNNPGECDLSRWRVLTVSDPFHQIH